MNQQQQGRHQQLVYASGEKDDGRHSKDDNSYRDGDNTCRDASKSRDTNRSRSTRNSRNIGNSKADYGIKDNRTFSDAKRAQRCTSKTSKCCLFKNDNNSEFNIGKE
jgi:hypothetical protein